MSTEYSEQQQRINNLSKEVLKLSRNTIIVNLRFLDAALAKLKFTANRKRRDIHWHGW